MSRLNRVLAVLCPSVPPRDQAVVLAAMEGRDLETPAVGAWGSASAAGDTTTAPTPLVGAGGLSGDGTTASERRPVPAQTPEGGCHLDPDAHPPVSDERLARLLSKWGATS